jgi:hypothetical protein
MDAPFFSKMWKILKFYKKVWKKKVIALKWNRSLIEVGTTNNPKQTPKQCTKCLHATRSGGTLEIGGWVRKCKSDWWEN